MTDADTPKSHSLMATLDRQNQDMGRGTLFFAGQGIRQRWQMQANMRSPAYTTRRAELQTVSA